MELLGSKIKTIIISLLVLAMVGTVTALTLNFRSGSNGIGYNLAKNLYDATDEILLALNNLSQQAGKAEIITAVDTSEKVIGLVFQGLSSAEINYRILQLLSEYRIQADFFLTGMLAAENSDFLIELQNKGHRIGSNTLHGFRKMENCAQEELLDDFARANTIIKSVTGKKPHLLMCNGTVYTDNLLEAAYAAGHKKVVKSTVFLNYQSFKNYTQVLNYVKNLKKGSIITIKMAGVLEEDEYDQPLEQVVVGEAPKIAINDAPKEKLTEDEKLLQMVGWLLKSLNENGYRIVGLEELESYKTNDKSSRKTDSPKITQLAITKSLPGKDNSSGRNTTSLEDNLQALNILRELNNGRKAKEYRTIYTTEKALSYTFYGIQNREVLHKVLDHLDAINAKGTFFVSKNDLLSHTEAVKEIAARGHELGICLLESVDKDFYSVLASITFIQEEVNKLTGQSPHLVRYPYDMKLGDEILEAISAANCTVVWQNVSIASSAVGRKGTLEEVLANVFGDRHVTAQRGYIIYFRMDYYEDPELIPAAVLKITKDRVDTVAFNDGVKHNGSSYAIKSVGDILAGDKIYTYPVAEKDILSTVKNAIYPGHLLGYSPTEKFNFMLSRYVGNPSLNTSSTLPGFTEEELTKINKSGRFTDDKVLFLTFDDWSYDKPINQILYVLNKHQVKASFFIRTNYVQNNPNILRAIAEEGHDVGSHSDQHLPFAFLESQPDDEITSYRSLNSEEVSERKSDLLLSYTKLQSVIGDLYLDGRPALNTYFRPPTLAMSRSGMEGIFDLGFSYIVNGDFSTFDYEDTDPQALADKILNGLVLSGGNKRKIQNGSIIILHLNDFPTKSLDSPNVTAQALDIVIPILKSQGYRFARLSDYLR